MPSARESGSGRIDPQVERPDRGALLQAMLERTGRDRVPVRRAFLQKPSGSDRGAALAEIVRARDVAALDAFLLIHAMASSSAPHVTWYPAATWTSVLALDEYAGPAAARSRWSKVVSRLVELRLIERERRGNKMNYWLLHESGDGEAYRRPRTIAHGSWFSLPYTYWFEGHYRTLTLAEKAMLLIALDQPEDSRLPYDRMPRWYGISASTAERGLTGLTAKGYLASSQEWRPEPKSPTGWTEDRRYNAVGPWSISVRRGQPTSSSRLRRRLGLTNAGVGAFRHNGMTADDNDEREDAALEAAALARAEAAEADEAHAMAVLERAEREGRGGDG